MQALDPSLVLDFQQLRDITLDDQELMREVLFALIDDTSRQLSLLSAAIEEQDVQRCMRLAHYSKGACANVGANRAAAMLKQIERDASRNAFDECSAELKSLLEELETLRQEATAM
ncbi:MAG TPA: Hpt domain-containing protein [Candidatus Acidoferrales bacterium]|nr:Hpt domain-containing protein [Candidatus Acidoferrales bacterium]